MKIIKNPPSKLGSWVSIIGGGFVTAIGLCTLLLMQGIYVHGDIRHLEISVSLYINILAVHGDIRHLEI